jgi:hypothetical protein
VAGVIAVIGLVIAISTTPAQPGGFGGFRMSGRFVVAHATATQVLILDTTTGSIFKAGEKDFKAYSELAKSLEGGGFPGFGKDGFGPKEGFKDFGKKEGFGKKDKDGRRPPPDKDD